MKKEQITVTNNSVCNSAENKGLEGKGMKRRLLHFKKRMVPAVSGVLMGVMLMSTTCFAAGTGTSAVTQPLENLKTLIIAVIGAVDILMAQSEDEAKDIALSLELFVNGSLNIFNHQTNVDVDNRFTVYGIRDLGTELSPITMLVMMESIQNRIVENGKRGKATWLYIDEFHVLLNSEYSAKYLQQLWKKVRKQGGLCTGITQNVVDLLQNYTATTMLANSEFVALLKQANTDSSKMADVIGVSEAQLRFVTNTASGMGLIKCGSVVIPFDNQISKDTDLYRLYNTNIHEKIAEQKKREMQNNVE